MPENITVSRSAVVRVLRRREVEHRTGLGRSAIYALIAKDKFPKPIRLTEKAVGWTEASVEAWIAERIAATDRAASR
jgi:prophage regulatory protein